MLSKDKYRSDSLKSRAARLIHLIYRLDSLRLYRKAELAKAMGITVSSLNRYMKKLSSTNIERALAAMQEHVDQHCIELVTHGCSCSRDIGADLAAIDYQFYTPLEKEILQSIGSVLLSRREGY